MAGHRDDGTFAEDKAHHPNRKVVSLAGYREVQNSKKWQAMREHPSYKGHADDANPYGIVRPDLSGIEMKED